VRRLAVRILERAGFAVLDADDGRATLSLYREHAAVIDAVILDVEMPDMGGADVYRALRAFRADVRILIMSGLDPAEVERRFGEGRPLEFVAGPFSPGQLVEAVDHVLAGSGD
jgi:two-component system cell cycle sensor histidine kinase/response regulator CckA